MQGGAGPKAEGRRGGKKMLLQRKGLQGPLMPSAQRKWPKPCLACSKSWVVFRMNDGRRDMEQICHGTVTLGDPKGPPSIKAILQLPTISR